MDDMIKAAFDDIRADETLKNNTKALLHGKVTPPAPQHRRFYRLLASMCAVILLLSLFGYASYAVPVAAVSIDSAPSVELELNVYDRVISVNSYDDSSSVPTVINMSCTDAVEIILRSFADGTDGDDAAKVTVTSTFSSFAERIRKRICDSTAVSEADVYCLTDRSDVEAARDAGISFGKYRIYLEIIKTNPDLTIEDARNMTMHELCSLLNAQAGSTGNDSGNGNGNGNGSGNGNGNGPGHDR